MSQIRGVVVVMEFLMLLFAAGSFFVTLYMALKLKK
ncbi:hypothetical protein J2S74_005418 [Evansella vedderi]|uniref:NADH dehydrogenase subunit 1 n=1 Tax=Evansella vedderi TaxID=38282 RepID=A0ABU0A382_9BACI|nr:hypothetical protein [Evansella vedderi]